jgi:curved DNA-binding protein CbpA
MNGNYYKILGVKYNASAKEIHSSYRKLAKKHHPDLAGGDAEKFRQIAEAYSVLSDVDLKASYDAGLIENNQKPAKNMLTNIFGIYTKGIIGSVLIIYGLILVFMAGVLGPSSNILSVFSGVFLIFAGFSLFYYLY